MYDKLAGTAEIGESAYVDAFLGVEHEGDEVSVTSWNYWFSISIGALVTTTCDSALKGSLYIDAVIGVELEKGKVTVTGWNSGSLISIGDLVRTTGTETLGHGLAV